MSTCPTPAQRQRMSAAPLVCAKGCVPHAAGLLAEACATPTGRVPPAPGVSGDTHAELDEQRLVVSSVGLEQYSSNGSHEVRVVMARRAS